MINSMSLYIKRMAYIFGVVGMQKEAVSLKGRQDPRRYTQNNLSKCRFEDISLSHPIEILRGSGDFSRSSFCHLISRLSVQNLRLQPYENESLALWNVLLFVCLRTFSLCFPSTWGTYKISLALLILTNFRVFLRHSVGPVANPQVRCFPFILCLL